MELIAEVVAERAGLRVRLYRLPGGLYRIRAGSGLGWAPDTWRDPVRAMARLLACASYGPAEVDALRRMCKPAS